MAMEGGGTSVWTGMTIRDILEKVDLVNINEPTGNPVKNQKSSMMMDHESSPDRKGLISVSDPTSAYLGPKLWDNPISLQDLIAEDEGCDVMNMDEFLAENNLSFDMEPQQEQEQEQADSPMWSQGPVSPPVFDVKPLARPSIIVAPKRKVETSPAVLPKGENTFLYAESKRAKMEREKEERRRKFEIEMDFAPEDLALATVPGMDFDPKQRAFNLEELRPQPIIRKRKKNAVPEEMKDERYWDKRTKNQIALRAAFLEKENAVMKKELESSQFEKSKLKTEIEILKQKLADYEPMAMSSAR